MADEHYPVAIHPFPEDGRVMVACACGYFSGGVTGARWTFEYDGLGGVRTSPSLDVPGHFHTRNPSEYIRVVTTFGDFARARDRYPRQPALPPDAPTNGGQ